MGVRRVRDCELTIIGGVVAIARRMLLESGWAPGDRVLIVYPTPHRHSIKAMCPESTCGHKWVMFYVGLGFAIDIINVTIGRSIFCDCITLANLKFNIKLPEMIEVQHYWIIFVHYHYPLSTFYTPLPLSSTATRSGEARRLLKCIELGSHRQGETTSSCTKKTASPLRRIILYRLRGWCW